MLKANSLSLSLGGRQILKDVSLILPNHGVTAVMGRSGIGKTTLLRVLAGLIKPDDGNIESTFERISVKFQDPRLFEWLTVLENVTAVLDGKDKNADRQVARQWLEAVGLQEDMDKYPPELSGGMAQRASLARALAYGGDLLLLDEPFSAVDDGTKDTLLSLIAEYAKMHAVLLVTHTQEEAEALNATIYQLG